MLSSSQEQKYKSKPFTFHFNDDYGLTHSKIIFSIPNESPNHLNFVAGLWVILAKSSYFFLDIHPSINEVLFKIWIKVSSAALRCAQYMNIVYIYIYITTCHFRWPCAIFADTGVFKIRITILKSMQFVAFLWDFSQITFNHQSNTKNNIYKYDFFKYEIDQVPWNSMEFHGTSKKVPWNSMELFGGKLKVPWNSMELGSVEKVPWNSMELWIWTKFHGIPWNSMEPHMLFKCCSKSSMELWRKFHGTFWPKSFNKHWKEIFNDILLRNE